MAEIDERLRDLLYLVAYLKRHPGAPLRDVAGVLGVPVAQVLSYADELLLCGKPPFAPDDLIDIYAEGGRLYLSLDQSLGRPLRLAAAEALALSIALRALGATRGDPFADAARSALAKIAAKLTGDVAGRVAAVEHRIVVRGEDRGAEDRLDVIDRGRREKREVEIRYWTASRDDISRRRLRPYLLLQRLGSWYVVGHDDRRAEPRIFKVERILGAALTAKRFAVPADFHPDRYLEGVVTGGEERMARVLFRPPVARIVAEDWPADRIEKRRDGTVVGRMPYASPDGLSAWVLAFGEGAEVLDPPALRAAVAARARATLAQYGG